MAKVGGESSGREGMTSGFGLDREKGDGVQSASKNSTKTR